MLWLIGLLLVSALAIGALLGRLALATNGCDSHHWGEYESAEDLRGSISLVENSPFTRPNRIRVQVERKHTAECEHTGCHEETVQWRTAMNFTKQL